MANCKTYQSLCRSPYEFIEQSESFTRIYMYQYS